MWTITRKARASQKMTYFNNNIMNNNEQSTNGNTQLNSERSNLNNRVSRFMMLGRSKKVAWDARRRNRTI